MNIKELNEAIGRALNEISDAPVNAVADKRKDAFDKKSMEEAWTDTGDKEQAVLDSIEEKIDEFFPNATINHYIDSYTGKSFGKVYIPYSDINLSSEQLEILDEKINTEYFISINDKRFNEGQPYAYFNDKAKRIEVGDFADKVKKSSFVKNVVTVIKDLYNLIEQQGKSESVADKKSMKEEMEYNRRIWDIFEENIAEYLKEQGVKPEGNNVMKYISKNAREIVEAVLNKEYNYEEDAQAIFELYYNCPIHFTDKVQAINNLLEEYLAESLKRCLTIEDKLIQLSK